MLTHCLSYRQHNSHAFAALLLIFAPYSSSCSTLERLQTWYKEYQCQDKDLWHARDIHQLGVLNERYIVGARHNNFAVYKINIPLKTICTYTDNENPSPHHCRITHLACAPSKTRDVYYLITAHYHIHDNVDYLQTWSLNLSLQSITLLQKGIRNICQPSTSCRPFSKIEQLLLSPNCTQGIINIRLEGYRKFGRDLQTGLISLSEKIVPFPKPKTIVAHWYTLNLAYTPEQEVIWCYPGEPFYSAITTQQEQTINLLLEMFGIIPSSLIIEYLNQQYYNNLSGHHLTVSSCGHWCAADDEKTIKISNITGSVFCNIEYQPPTKSQYIKQLVLSPDADKISVIFFDASPVIFQRIYGASPYFVPIQHLVNSNTECTDMIFMSTERWVTAHKDEIIALYS